MARYFNRDSMSDTFDHIQKVSIFPMATPLEILLDERHNDALCTIHITAEDYTDHLDDRKKLKMSFMFCRKDKYWQMREHLAQIFPSTLVLEHTGTLDFGLPSLLNSDTATILSELISTRLWILPFYPSIQHYTKTLTPYGVSFLALCKRTNLLGLTEKNNNLCICDLLIFGKPAPHLLIPPSVLHVSDLFDIKKSTPSSIKQLIQTLHEAGSYMSGMLDYNPHHKEVPLCK